MRICRLRVRRADRPRWSSSATSMRSIISLSFSATSGTSPYAASWSGHEVKAETLADTNRRKDEFLAMLSHELRNPLAGIMNASHLLRLDSENEEPDPTRGEEHHRASGGATGTSGG